MRRTELTTLAPSFRIFSVWYLDGLARVVFFRATRADTVDEDIGEGGEEQAELVGFVGVRAHAIGKQIELAVLDAVFHVAAWA